MTIDFEREGLLAGCEDEAARAARIQLLEELTGAGVPVAELRRAVAEDRLALLPVERLITGDARYTLSEVAEQSGLDEEFLAAQRQAFGLPRPGADDAVLTDDDLRAAQHLKRFRDAGLSDGGQLEAARVMGQSMSAVAAVSRELVGQAGLRPGDSELELGRRYAEVAAQLAPLMGPLLEYAYRIHLREGLRRDVVGRSERESGRLPGGTEVTVAFADLVDFTRLGEHLSVTDLGRVAGRLATLAAAVAEPPVTLVKTIGDAAMLVSPEPEPLLAATLAVVAAADEEGEDFPQLRAGIASGRALNRAGDWYGRPVNLASRITGVARPGSVLTTREVQEAIGDGYRWSRAPARHFKGIDGRVPLSRVRPRAEPDGDAADGDEPDGVEPGEDA